MSKYKIIMTGGGTAGHVTPNLALIPSLEEKGFEVKYIGSKDGIEKEIVRKNNIPYFEISSGKLRRYFDLKNFSDPFKVIKGVFEAKRILSKEKPDVVFSKGGFVSVPVVIAASLKKIPVVAHESDITPGLANKLSIPFAKKICYATPETQRYVPKNKSLLTGIPVRKSILRGSKKKGLSLCGFSSNKPIVLIIGGSLGAKSINSAIREGLDELLLNYQICHLTGEAGFDSNYDNISGYKQFSYLNSEMADIFQMADIVISRAGATTLFELLSLKKPNILIPLPKNVSRGDQILNANYFKKEGFSEVIEEDILNNSVLIEYIKKTLNHKDKYIAAMDKSELNNSVELITNLIKEVSNKKRIC